MDIPNKKLVPFFEAIKSIPCRNAGGCLFFCYVFWKWLVKNGYPTDTFQIVQYDSNHGADIKHNEQWINGNEDSPTSSSHFSWLYDGIEYDGEGLVNKARWSLEREYNRTVLHGLNTLRVCLIEDFCLEALNFSSWNNAFERETALEIIQINLGINLWSEINCYA